MACFLDWMAKVSYFVRLVLFSQLSSRMFQWKPKVRSLIKHFKDVICKKFPSSTPDGKLSKVSPTCLAFILLIVTNFFILFNKNWFKWEKDYRSFFTVEFSSSLRLSYNWTELLEYSWEWRATRLFKSLHDSRGERTIKTNFSTWTCRDKNNFSLGLNAIKRFCGLFSFDWVTFVSGRGSNSHDKYLIFLTTA